MLSPAFPYMNICSNRHITFPVLITKKLPQRQQKSSKVNMQCTDSVRMEWLCCSHSSRNHGSSHSVGWDTLYVTANIFAHHIVLEISKHISKQQHKLINELGGWMCSTVPCSLDALYILYNNLTIWSHPYQSNNRKRIENPKESFFKSFYLDGKRAFLQ